MEGKAMINGVNVEQLFSTIEAIKNDPGLALFKFRATNRWIGGTHNQAMVKDFYGAREENNSREPWVFEIDEPRVLCGNDLAANPVEYLLVALSGCLTTSLVAHAAARGIKINGVSSRYEGELDLRGFLGLSEEVPVGYRSIRLYFTIDAEISAAEKEELVRMAQKYSPVFNTIAKPVAMSAHLDWSSEADRGMPMAVGA